MHVLKLAIYGVLAFIALSAARLLQHVGVPKVPAIAAAVGLTLILFIAYVHSWRQSWIATVGVIKDVTERSRNDPDQQRVIVRQISYDYEVAGRRFSGTDALETDATGYDREEELLRWRDTYKAGRPITIYHSRSTPAASSLARGAKLRLAVITIGGLVLWVVCGYFVYVASLKMLANKAPEPTSRSVTPRANDQGAK